MDSRAGAGFVKKHVNEQANDAREELGLGPVDRLDPLLLAEHLLIPVHKLSAQGDPGAAYLLHREPEAFSAVTIFEGSRRRIVHNDAHSLPRQNSNICHELSHGLLLHEPSPALTSEGLRDWDQVMEDQAQWMAGVLLLPEEALIQALRRGSSEREIAFRYGVSLEMVRWRINKTGARNRVARGRAKYRRTLAR